MPPLPIMELVPCNSNARQSLADSLFHTDSDGIFNKKLAEYVAKTFPDIILDVARLLVEQAITARNKEIDQSIVIRQQLKPYFMFEFLLGKCPQVTSLMFSYFENSSFQPLPENSYSWNLEQKAIVYDLSGFNDDIVKQILVAYFKYLSFNSRWFSAVWNWGELGRFITSHGNSDIRYLAGCCLSIITRPTRLQHISNIGEIIGRNQHQLLIDLHIKHRHIYDNTFKPCLETQTEKAEDFARSMGFSESGYSFCSDSMACIANVLMLKRDVSSEKLGVLDLYAKIIKDFIPVSSLSESISKIAYSININKPCLLRGPSGCGKTGILDYIAARVNRANPPEYVKVQIGDQIDSKLLIGSYVCTEIPGQFEWQPGPLTKAMVLGSWIVFEDIDSASADMVQVLHSVIENGNLSCVASCPIKIDSPHPDFRVFFTQQSQRKRERPKLGHRFIERLCDIIDLPDLLEDDLKTIIDSKYALNQITPLIIELFKLTNAHLDDDTIKFTRKITQRDLYKLCERISARKIMSVGNEFAAIDLDNIFLDAVDCFIAYLPHEQFIDVSEAIGKVLNLPRNALQRLFSHTPEIHHESGNLNIGRVRLKKNENSGISRPRSILAHTKQSSQLLEKLAICINNKEPVLLVGETGVGKTSVIQYLADASNTELVVINLSQQSDSSDLLGGFKPVEIREIIKPLHEKFQELFKRTFDSESNRTFLDHVTSCFTVKRKNQWTIYLKLVTALSIKALNKLLPKENLDNWKKFHDKAKSLLDRFSIDKDSTSMALTFSEGSLLRAINSGKWILLDEINLAEPDVLQCLLTTLDSIKRSKVYMNGINDSDKPVRIHSNFRIFACMNPSTDVGKRDLAISIRGRFTEFFVNDITEASDLRLVVESYAKPCLSHSQIEGIVNFYREVRSRQHTYTDISGNSPVFSLRTLCRALVICANNVCHNMERSLLESLRITFLQQLDLASSCQITGLIESIILKKDISGLEKTPIRKPQDDHQYVEVEGFWIQQRSNRGPECDNNYILTKSVKRNLCSLSRIISLSQRKLPILIQGHTSVGKTSLIKYLADITGNKCYRINNHEHTDLQDYVGRYVLREDGEFIFQEGLLVQAMKKGYWIILDELNLAPCELLEALNRVLDENRELFIPETREIIKAHSRFMLFATQNPPEQYAGRKLLSRAFRNRFVEINFDEIPSNELEFILHEKCEMPLKYAEKIVAVMRELQLLRRESGCFNGKNSFMTMRDLFRWGERYAISKNDIPDDTFHDWNQHVAREGLILLEGRARTYQEAESVRMTIEKIFKCILDREAIYASENISKKTLPENFRHICFTREFRNLYVQMSHALKYKEPVLLCGLTGCGKTTSCQLYAASKKQSLLTYNCHLNTESMDFIGGVRPSRQDDSSKERQKFPWVDGPLVEAMKSGAIFLMDEISLADDAVLERINSVLEPDRSLTLTEKNGEEIVAKSSFRLVSTMNPGGDYGKKELSPALRNRFTEIYCHSTSSIDQILDIIEGYLGPVLLKPKFAPSLLSLMSRFIQDYYRVSETISIRDIQSWCRFLMKSTNVEQVRPLSLQDAIVHGAALVFFDQFGTCGHRTSNVYSEHSSKIKLKLTLKRMVVEKFGVEPIFVQPRLKYFDVNQDLVIFKRFALPKGPTPIYTSALEDFVTEAPTVKKNIIKIVRAMQLDRPILLEGDPGAGKTSIVGALAKLTGNKLVRINLSEQTDISDLFGSDLPCVDDDYETPEFSWHDGPMLNAIRESHWILLDEMNLASQSVLEGLNACLDHRGEIFIPELNKKILIDRSSSRIFACQNPYSQGAARKGLPQSFINRFTSIHMQPHEIRDLNIIIEKLYPRLPGELIQKLVLFNQSVSKLPSVSVSTNYEFNLRDIIYWCDLLTRYVYDEQFKQLNLYRPDRFVQFVYLDRIRVFDQRSDIAELFENIFGYPIYEPSYRDIRLGDSSFMLARAILPRKLLPPPHLPDLCILKYQLPYMESIAKAIEHSKMPIIVGEAGVGKRSMVRILAALTGNELNIIGANRDMDTVELLGSFEQKSIHRTVIELVGEAKEFVLSIFNSISHKEYGNTWKAFFLRTWAILYSSSIKDFKKSSSEIMSSYQFQLAQMKELIEKAQVLSEINTEKRCQQLISKIDKLIEYTDQQSLNATGNFQWINSILIESIRKGHWLLIENSSLMNPATLDRLNSLVEPNGSLSLNEKGSGAEGIETLIPHPDFRLILTVNPEDGELSRAMRNRGSEIFIQTKFYFEDFLMLLNLNGFEQEDKKACMAYCLMQTSYDAHKKITGEDLEGNKTLSSLAYFGLNYIKVLAHQVRLKVKIDCTLADLILAFYSHKGFAKQCDQTMRQYILEQMQKNRKAHEVNLNDERYKWLNLRHDLPSLIAGDASTSMVERDHRIFFYDFSLDLLKSDEMIEDIDIVNTCITIKIFLELSTHGDFECRKGFIKETFASFPKMLNIVNNHVDLLHSEYLPIIRRLTPQSDYIPVGEIYVDSRNSPDIDYYLQSFDLTASEKRQVDQNRWILSLHRIMLRMINELAEDRSLEKHGHTSLWALSEKVRTGDMYKEDLIRPNSEIASDIFDLFDGILRVVGNRCFTNDMVSKMLPRFFWISYFINKLKKGHSREELVAICNQLPMLWALTYQKVIVPIVRDCDMADLNFKNKKFSNRIKNICDFLDVSLTKPTAIEKAYHNKIVNRFASTTKTVEAIRREIDKSFAALVGRYTARTSTIIVGSSITDQRLENLTASYTVWSNSPYTKQLYDIEDSLIQLDIADKSSDDGATSLYEEIMTRIQNIRTENDNREGWLQDDRNRVKCASLHKRFTSLDQFAPIWQLHLVRYRFAKMIPHLCDPSRFIDSLRSTISSVNGIILSPNYYSTMMKYAHYIQDRKSINEVEDETEKHLREDVDAFTAFTLDHLVENTILDHQIVGWTKLRVTTSDLHSVAPLIPEYAPLISLVGCYCLDIPHLKLNFYMSSSAPLRCVLKYLWKNYMRFKRNPKLGCNDIKLAKTLLHIRCRTNLRNELVGNYICESTKECKCIDAYIRLRLKTYDELMNLMKSSLNEDDYDIITTGIQLVYYGYLNYLEYAPIFTLDPAIRSREKLEIYKSELAQVKLELHFRNTLFYWKTGENLQLNEVDLESAAAYPFSVRILVERRIKLEKSINKLSRNHTNRPRSDDGSLYYELRREVEVIIQRYTSMIQSIIADLTDLVKSSMTTSKLSKLNNLNSRCRLAIKSLEKALLRFKSEYALYSDLSCGFLTGLCFVQQGLRCLYSRLEQIMQIRELGFNCSVRSYLKDITRVYSFNEFTRGNLELVNDKLQFFSRLGEVCSTEEATRVQSILLRTVLIQLNHHITITPSDIDKCIPIVGSIADKFQSAWLERKLYLEEQRKQKEDLYQYKTSRNTLGAEISFERQEFLDLCSKFPTYDHVYLDIFSIPPTSADKENLETEEKMCNLNRSVDLSMCIDICKAHYKFIKQASQNLLIQNEMTISTLTPTIDFGQLIKLEAETLYSILRNCTPTLDQSIDSLTVECHLLQTKSLIQTIDDLNINQPQLNSMKSSVDILDEETFDIYHHPNVKETLRLQEFLHKLFQKIQILQPKAYETHPSLTGMSKLISRLSSFLITEPFMKFVTGSHALLEKLDNWNQLPLSKEDKLNSESMELIDLITRWRTLEIESWRSSLHRTKRKYIDGSLCDLWFSLYEAFNNPIVWVSNLLRHRADDESLSISGDSEELYLGFVLFIKEFIEESTIGDYQIRLDLVFSFAIQTRFASLYKQAQPHCKKESLGTDKDATVDFEKLFNYVYNTFRQYQGLLEPIKDVVKSEEEKFLKELNNEIRIVAWQGRNLYDIKNNFRNSHRKLNKVMNRYLEMLRRSLPCLGPVKYSPDLSAQSKDDFSIIAKITSILDSVNQNISKMEPKVIGDSESLDSLLKAAKIFTAMKSLFVEGYPITASRYLENLEVIYQTINSHSKDIINFYNHDVQKVVLDSKDTKEICQEKQKLCRQMYHSKRFALQSVFKSLQELGVSYQRGLNNQNLLDLSILSLEPLRGMIQNKSNFVLKAASNLIDDNMVTSCNEQYRKLIASNHILLAQPKGELLSNDQFCRIQGIALDMVLDIIGHNRSVAMMYRNLIDIQAAVTRLSQLQDKFGTDQILMFNFSTIHSMVKQLNDLVGRAYLAIAKLEKMTECYPNTIFSKNGEDYSVPNNQLLECSLIENLIDETDEIQSLMTKTQYDHIRDNLVESRKCIAGISDELRDTLKHTIRNYIYSLDDIVRLDQLFKMFTFAFRKLLPTDFTPTSAENNSIFASISTILTEAELYLEPKLTFASSQENWQHVKNHSKLDKLNIRLWKFFKQTMLASQAIYKEEAGPSRKSSDQDQMSSSAKRKLKPFNYVDSNRIGEILRIDKVAKHIGDCFITLNNEEVNTDIRSIVAGVTPVLRIYSNHVASYINIILTLLHLKLTSANQLVPFFSDLVVNGFGLPYKNEGDGNEGSTTKSKMSEDNSGFGDGAGDEDVSKKLEFESQLDGLKEVDNENDGKNDESVPDHDQGVEMSDDINAKAQGPDSQQSDNDTDENEQDEDENTDELDKEMDSVDRDEEVLDKNLWNDAGEDQHDEDDEQDLKEPDRTSNNINPELNDKQLEAKDEELRESNNKPPVDANKHDEPEEDLEAANLDNKQKQSDDVSNEDAKGEDNDQDELNLEEEANEANKVETEPDYMDMSPISSTEDLIMEQDPVDDGQSKDEGEMSGEEDQSSKNSIDDDEIDKHLESAQMQNMEKELGKTVEETIIANADGGENQVSEMKGQKLGSHTVYNIFDDDDDSDDIDNYSDDIDNDLNQDINHDDDTQNTEIGEQSSESKANHKNKKNPSKNQHISNVNDEELGKSPEREPQVDETCENEKKNAKRTYADRQEVDGASQKRQKILDAIEDKSDVNEGTKKADKMRHIGDEKNSTMDAIDLTSISSNDGDTEKHIITDFPTVQPNLEDEEVKEKVECEISGQPDPDQDSNDPKRLIGVWLDCTNQVSHLVYELCQQLQIVLQPTKMSKYKGDYKSGKRLNMRKIISYIASHYRKDKIWLRRTKPNKRTYNITIAVDNSSSMSENNCRQMTYQSLALLAKALSIIEAGSLSVVSFGQQVKCIHEFGQPYIDSVGASWLNELKFDENRTSYSQLLKHSCESFSKQIQMTQSGTNTQGIVSQLLIIISDGRHVSSDENEIKMDLRQLKKMGVLTLFIIIDDLKLNGGNSLVDVKRCIGIGSDMQMINYMELFPFPFYVLLRQLETMPLILGNSLRQWFELVSTS